MSPASSTWSRPSRTRGSPTSRSTVSWSAAVGSGRLGSVARTPCRRSSAVRARSVSAFTCADISRIRSRAGPASSPARLATAIPSDAAFCSWRRFSAAAFAARQSSSRSSTSSRRPVSPRRASAVRTASGSRRIRRRSSIRARDYAAPSGASLAGDARDVLRDGLDLGGLELALERRHRTAAVRHLALGRRLVGLQVVEVRPDLAARGGVLERVAAGAVLGEDLLALRGGLLRAAGARAGRARLGCARRVLLGARRVLLRARRVLLRARRVPAAGRGLRRGRDVVALPLAARVLGEERRDVVGLLSDDDVLGHD